MILLEGVTKVYEGGTVALRDIDLDVKKGEFVFVVGPSGSGKSTLISLLLREQRATRGKIWVAGKDITKMPGWKVPHLRRSVGTVFQDYKLLPNRTVAENVGFALEVLGRPRSIVTRQVQQVLELVGLQTKGDRYPRQLSGGEQQRVSVARAFVNRPPILLADEPTGNLDAESTALVLGLLDSITSERGCTFVVVTHDEAVSLRADRRLHLVQGALVPA